MLTNQEQREAERKFFPLARIRIKIVSLLYRDFYSLREASRNYAALKETTSNHGTVRDTFEVLTKLKLLESEKKVTQYKRKNRAGKIQKTNRTVIKHRLKPEFILRWKNIPINKKVSTYLLAFFHEDVVRKNVLGNGFVVMTGDLVKLLYFFSTEAYYDKIKKIGDKLDKKLKTQIFKPVENISRKKLTEKYDLIKSKCNKEDQFGLIFLVTVFQMAHDLSQKDRQLLVTEDMFARMFDELNSVLKSPPFLK